MSDLSFYYFRVAFSCRIELVTVPTLEFDVRRAPQIITRFVYIFFLGHLYFIDILMTFVNFLLFGVFSRLLVVSNY